MLDKNDFIEKLAEHAYISQEGMIAFDGSSAWYSLRLLDERKRMYDELYLDPRIRCIEAAAKYIITTYFVQKFNSVDFDTTIVRSYGEMTLSDLCAYRILMAVDDMIKMSKEDYLPTDLSSSVGEVTKRGLARCRNIIDSLDGGAEETLEEKKLLFRMYSQLVGDWTGEDEYGNGELTSYQDPQIQEMASQLTYKQLSDARKRIILNYPGVLLIDLYMPTRYFATPPSRYKRSRLDGTNCAEDTIMLPNSRREQWMNEDSLATITLSEYERTYGMKTNSAPVFQVFRIGQDKADCEHAINMLKKELQKKIETRNRGVKK